MNNAFQDFNEAITELKSTASKLVVSSCCHSGLKVEGEKDGTNYYTCVSCDKPCDAVPLIDVASLRLGESSTIVASEPTKIAKNVMPIAYVSGAYRSKWGWIGIALNILKARKVAIKYWRLGYACICPHMNTAFFDGKAPDDVWLKGDLAIINRLHRKTDVVVMMKGFKKSSGAKGELALAKKRRLRIIYE